MGQRPASSLSSNIIAWPGKSETTQDNIRSKQQPGLQDPNIYTFDPQSPLQDPALLDLIRAQFPDHDIKPLAKQGGCSFTLLCIRKRSQDAVMSPMGPAQIIQVRPQRFSVTLPLLRHACRIHASLVAEVEELFLPAFEASRGVLQVVRQPCLPGVPLSELQLLPRDCPAGPTTARVKNFLADLAAFHARAWTAGICDDEMSQRLMTEGRVGRTLTSRLEMLAKHLPSRALRRIACQTLREVQRGGLRHLPVVLTHGDLIASNVLVDRETWHITGIVDWAEAEWLPFGVNLYSLEVLFGALGSKSVTGRGWQRVERSALRAWFWQELEKLITGLQEGRKSVELARRIGVLLWFGFAWDDGRIDRVINKTDDMGDFSSLTACLRGSVPRTGRRSWGRNDHKQGTSKQQFWNSPLVRTDQEWVSRQD